MADRIKNYQQEADQITTLKEIRTDLGVTPSSYTPDSTVVTKDRVVTFSQAEEELVVLGDIEKGVKQQVVKGDIADNRITNIEKLLQGNLYDYQTDSTSAYTKTVPSGALPYAGIEQIGGKTIVWNQLMNENSAERTSLGITTSCTNNIIRITGTLTGTTPYIEIFTKLNPFVVGHKYYIRIVRNDPNDVGSAGLYFAISGGAYIEPTSAQSFIYNVTTYRGYIRARFRADQTTFDLGYTYNTTAYIKVSDLTLMFGSGNEPTAEEFETMFPNFANADQNAGTLLSAGVTSVVSNSTNIFDYDTYKSLMQSLSYPVTRGAVAFSGNGLTVTATSNDAFTAHGGALRIPIKPSVKYTLSVTVDKGGGSFWLFAYDSAGTSITNNHYNFASAGRYSTTITSTSASALLSYRFGVDTSGNSITFSDIQLEESETATEYKHYAFPSFPIPAEVRALEGYGWSAGSVYNYIDFERKVFVKRVASVDLGTQNWTYYTETGYGYNYFRNNANLSNMKVGTQNLIVQYYVTTTNRTVMSSNMMIAPYNNVDTQVDTQRVCIRDDSYTDATALKTALNGVYLYYELATPVETDISQYLTDNLIEVGAGGTLTFPNQNGADYHIPVPSTETYMIDLQEAISNG